MPVGGSYRVIPLIGFGQVRQKIPLFFGFIALKVEPADIIGTKADKCEFIIVFKRCLGFDEIIVVGWQKRQSDGGKQKLEVRAPVAYKHTGVFCQRTIVGKGQIRSADSKPAHSFVFG
ncbi:hypothetical protein DSECCO2_538880 [anaerobic digester metagenome]